MACCDSVRLAAERGHRECLERMRSEGKDIVNDVYKISIESRLGDTETLEKELSFDGTVLLDPNWRDHPSDIPPVEYRTALHSACAFGHLDLARWLVAEGASIHCEIYPRLGFTPLFCAVNYRRRNVIRWLLESGASPNAKVVEPDYGRMFSGFDPHFNQLFNSYCTTVHGSTPLFVACEVSICLATYIHSVIHLCFRSVQVGDVEAVRMLLEFGANPSLGRRHEDCYNLVEGHEGPLAVAIRTRRIDIAELLVRAGADIHAECVLANSLNGGVDYIKLLV
eukprot:Opistho-1_new@93373